MAAGLSRGGVGIARCDRFDDAPMRVLVAFVSVMTADAQHVDHGLSRTRREASVELAGFQLDGPATTITLRAAGGESVTRHDGVGPIEALTAALEGIGSRVDILSLHQTSTGSGSDSEAVTIVEYRDGASTGWVAAKDRSVLTASLHAVLRAATAAT